ncbi:conjugal transfer protein TraF [Burkholderia gladioli]|nr:conjugal transfer protein TraF [Burkholderia gladioli]
MLMDGKKFSMRFAKQPLWLAGGIRSFFPAAAKAALAFAIIGVTGASSPAMAQVASGNDLSYFQGKNDGWFFYNDPKPQKKVQPPPPPIPKPVVAAPAQPASAPPEPLSVAWLRGKMPILRDNAINNPTRENVKAYLATQRVMLDMAQNFTNTATKVATTDPYLSENFRLPQATFASRETRFLIAKARNQIIDNVSQHAGLWFFFDSKCAFCQLQYETLTKVKKNTKFVVRYISTDGAPLPGMKSGDFVADQDQRVFRSLGLKLTPAVVLAWPPNKYLIVAQGAMDEGGLYDKIVLAVTDQNLVPKSLTDAVNLEQRGILTPRDLATLRSTNADTDDPKVLVKMIENAIDGRLQQ